MRSPRRRSVFAVLLAAIGLWPLLDGAPPRTWPLAGAGTFLAVELLAGGWLSPAAVDDGRFRHGASGRRAPTAMEALRTRRRGEVRKMAGRRLRLRRWLILGVLMAAGPGAPGTRHVGGFYSAGRETVHSDVYVELLVGRGLSGRFGVKAGFGVPLVVVDADAGFGVAPKVLGVVSF